MGGARSGNHLQPECHSLLLHSGNEGVGRIQLDLVDPDLDPPEWHNLLLHTGEGVGRIQLDLVCPDLQARQMHAQRNAHIYIH